MCNLRLERNDSATPCHVMLCKEMRNKAIILFVVLLSLLTSLTTHHWRESAPEDCDVTQMCVTSRWQQSSREESCDPFCFELFWLFIILFVFLMICQGFRSYIYPNTRQSLSRISHWSSIIEIHGSSILHFYFQS